MLNDIINQTVGTPEDQVDSGSLAACNMASIPISATSLSSANSNVVPVSNLLEPHHRPLSTLVEARHNSVQSSSTGTAAALARARRESRKISMMLEDDDEGPRLKERMTEALQQFIDIFCVWDCCQFYIKLSEVREGLYIAKQNYTFLMI